MTVKPVLWMVTVAGLLMSQPAAANDKVSIIMSWVAEAEHGGFYQALATGIYARHGLDVTIRQGGPQLNTGQMLAAGAVDFRVGFGAGDADIGQCAHVHFRQGAAAFHDAAHGGEKRETLAEGAQRRGQVELNQFQFEQHF